jgi:cellulose synthase/poly-beta-1,6-N-acetylglucosamine synthase-like glycosyltransferase
MNDILPWVFEVLTIIIIVYMSSTAISYFLLFLFSLRKVRREGKLDKKETLEDTAVSHHTIPVSIIVPAFNEEIGIVSTISLPASFLYTKLL